MLASYPASILNQITRRVGKQIRFSLNASRSNTTTSMGRLTLNILLSFAQYERELIGERVRDKVAASRARGMWMGGPVPLGYRVENRKLLVDEAGAATVNRVFEGFAEIGSGTKLLPILRAEGLITKSGKPFDKSALYKLLVNRVYLGEAVHKGTSYPGEHAGIVSQELWDRVHGVLQESPPEIIEAVLDGRQPDGMTLPGLMEPFPIIWPEQRLTIGNAVRRRLAYSGGDAWP